jgi:hypothetical protein
MINKIICSKCYKKTENYYSHGLPTGCYVWLCNECCCRFEELRQELLIEFLTKNMCQNCYPLTKKTKLKNAYLVDGTRDDDNFLCYECNRYINENELASLGDK